MELNFELEEDFWWQTRANLPSWQGFQSRGGPYASNDSEESCNGDVTIIFAAEGRDIEPLSDEEIETVKWFIENEQSIATSLLAALKSEYPKFKESYGYDEEELAEYMPVAENEDDFKKLMGLSSVNIHPLEKDGVPYVGFEFGCSWDPEHGLGILMHGTRVVEIGGADTAILLWIAENDAKAR